jgi:hypothetical protein
VGGVVAQIPLTELVRHGGIDVAVPAALYLDDDAQGLDAVALSVRAVASRRR